MNRLHPVSRSKSALCVIFAAALFAVLVSFSCTNGGQAPKTPDTQRDLETSQFDGTKPGISEQPDYKKNKPGKPGSTVQKAIKLESVFDFSSNLARAHLRSKGLLIDFGTPARHKYTLGDWKSGWIGDFENDNTTYSFIKSQVGHVFFDAHHSFEEGATITFRARAGSRSEAKVYLNGEFLDSVQFPDSDFTHASLKISGGIVRGQNELLIRCSGPKRRSPRSLGCLGVDYIRISQGEYETGPAASTFDSVKYPDASGGKDLILLASGESITFNLSVEEGMRLKGKARARQLEVLGHIEFTAITNSGKEDILVDMDLSDRDSRIDVSLDRFKGETVALTATATTGDILLGEVGLSVPKEKKSGASGEVGAKNVVLILIDTLRTDRLSVYNGETRVRTPYLDALARESMVFERAFAPENWTKPSVASLLSGLHPMTHLAKDDRDRVPSSVILAPEHFGQLDFETAGFVANGYVSGKFGFKEGWHTWTNYVREGKANRAKYVVEDAIAWLKSRKTDKPFFLYVHTIDPHVPYIPPQKYLAMYDSGRYGGPIKSSQTAHQLAKIKTGKLKLNERDKLRLEALYDGEISYHDDQLVRLHETMDTMGLLDDTLVIVTSDHGEEFFEHGSVGHGHSLYEELLHVPLMVRLPGAEEGEPARSDVEVNLVDVLPTICDVLGVECPVGLQGRSLMSLIDGTGSSGYGMANFSEFLSGQRAARMGRYKVIYRGLGAHLYDLSMDPLETDDLRDKCPVTLALMRDTLGMHLGSFGEVQKEEEPKQKPKKHKTEKTHIDKETERQLKALGYLNED